MKSSSFFGIYKKGGPQRHCFYRSSATGDALAIAARRARNPAPSLPEQHQNQDQNAKIYTYKRSFCQDGLGTNIGNAQVTVCLVAVPLSLSLRACPKPVLGIQNGDVFPSELRKVVQMLSILS